MFLFLLFFQVFCKYKFVSKYGRLSDCSSEYIISAYNIKENECTYKTSFKCTNNSVIETTYLFEDCVQKYEDVEYDFDTCIETQKYFCDTFTKNKYNYLKVTEYLDNECITPYRFHYLPTGKQNNICKQVFLYLENIKVINNKIYLYDMNDKNCEFKNQIIEFNECSEINNNVWIYPVSEGIKSNTCIFLIFIILYIVI